MGWPTPHHTTTTPPPHHTTETVKALPDNIGSWFSVYNLILTQLSEICKKKMRCHQQKTQKNVTLPDNLGSWFSVYNLILTQLDEICKKIIGVPYKFKKKLGCLKKKWKMQMTI